METAGIIIIGNEILSGKAKDINSSYLCQELRALGVEVRQIITIPDISEIIGKTAVDFSKKFENGFFIFLIYKFIFIIQECNYFTYYE